jgi:hypothetical protein
VDPRRCAPAVAAGSDIALKHEYLRELARFSPDSKEIQLPNFTSFRWVDETKYRADAEMFLTGIRGVVSNLRNALIRSGLLTEEEAIEVPKLEVHVNDDRKEHHDPFPIIEWKIDP